MCSCRMRFKSLDQYNCCIRPIFMLFSDNMMHVPFDRRLSKTKNLGLPLSYLSSKFRELLVNKLWHYPFFKITKGNKNQLL